MADNTNIRNQNFFKHFDSDKIKQEREEGVIQLRKKKRFEYTNNKRSCMGIDANVYNNIVFPIENIPFELRNSMPQLFDARLSAINKIFMLIQVIKTTDDLNELEGFLQVLKKIFGKNEKIPYDMIFDDNLVDIFTSLLNCDISSIKTLVLWCMINIFNNAPKTIQKFVDKGIFNKLAYIIKGEKNASVLENAI